MTQLLTDDEVPSGFIYPTAFLRAVDVGLLCLEPWRIMLGEELVVRMRGLAERFPDRTLVPFARRQDNDDVACWDLARSGRVAIVHDFASPGWERRDEFEDFNAWLRQAVDDFISFE